MWNDLNKQTANKNLKNHEVCKTHRKVSLQA